LRIEDCVVKKEIGMKVYGRLLVGDEVRIGGLSVLRAGIDFVVQDGRGATIRLPQAALLNARYEADPGSGGGIVEQIGAVAQPPPAEKRSRGDRDSTPLVIVGQDDYARPWPAEDDR
jgi:hypothetical protein